MLHFLKSLPLKFLTILFIASAFSAPANAADTDSQIWTSVTATTAITPEIDMALELHARFTEDSSVTGQRLIRPSVTYKINNNLSLTGGYFYGTFNTSTTPSFHEHRLWQQIGYTFLHEENGMVFGGRTRLEERFMENANDTGWRLRQQLRFESPFIPDTMLKGLIWNETFIGLNKTSWGQRSDVDQTRTFLGFAMKLNNAISIEPGYLNQVIFREGTNRVNHVAAVNFFVRF